MQVSKWRVTFMVALLLLVMATPVLAQAIPKERAPWLIARQLTVDRTSTLTGNVSMGGDLSVADDSTFGGTLIYTPATTQTVTMNDAITADSAVVLLTSAGTVNTSNVACGPNGAQVTYINVGAQSIVLTDTGTLKLSGNTTLGALDNIVLQSVWGNCIEIAQADN